MRPNRPNESERNTSMSGPHSRFSMTLRPCALALSCAMVLSAPWAIAQITPTAPPPPPSAAPAMTSANLEKLVGPIALFPDDLVSIILPASTFPLQIVQASRFFDQRKANPKLEPPATWDDSV